MKPDKETFEAIIADLEETRNFFFKEVFAKPAPLDEPYFQGFNAGFKAAITQVKRRKKLFIGD